MKAVLDFGQSKDVNDHQRIGYVKNAQITWKQNGWTLNAGLITTTQFKVQEDFWGKRYVMKSFQDEYKFGSSADLGVSVAYKFNKVVSADVIVANGEGYKKVQVKDGLQYGAGVTLTPVEGLTVRAYGSYNESVEEGEKVLRIWLLLSDISIQPSQWQRNTTTRPIRNMCLIVIRMVSRFMRLHS